MNYILFLSFNKNLKLLVILCLSSVKPLLLTLVLLFMLLIEGTEFKKSLFAEEGRFILELELLLFK